MKKLVISLALCATNSLFAQQNCLGNTSPTYEELIAHLQQLDRSHKEVKLYNMGASDYGQPIYLCVINGHRDSSETYEKARHSTPILITKAPSPAKKAPPSLPRWLQPFPSIPLF
jgi:hypothetical protein